MERIAAIIFDVVSGLIFVGWILFWFGPRYWFFDYRFHATGIDVVCFGGRLRLGTFAKDKIYSIRLLAVADITERERATAIYFCNRMKTEYLLVETQYQLRSWLLTPADPRAALAAMYWGMN